LPQKMADGVENVPLGHREPPVQRVKKLLGKWFVEFKKTPFTIPVGIAITCGFFYLSLVYLITSCLASLLPPFVMFGVFWSLGIKRAKKLLLLGLITTVAVLAVETTFFVTEFHSAEPAIGTSEDGVLINGIITPFSGDSSTLYNFTIQVDHNATLSDVIDVRVLVASFTTDINASMTLLGYDNATNISSYYYTTQLNDPYNQFIFKADLNGTWISAFDRTEGEEYALQGPVYTDSWTLASAVLRYYSLLQAFGQFFGMYAVVVGMIWWTRRARRMREKQIKTWEEERGKEEVKEPEGDAKVPSLARAMGTSESEADETFVCSECGADVPGDAEKCPVCSEKFD
jgi:hypothetical protein